MSFQQCIEDRQTIQSKLIDFIDCQDHVEENFQQLQEVILSQKITENSQKFKSFVFFLRNICNNHRSPDLIDKMKRVFLFIKSDLTKMFSNSFFYETFKENKRILLLLIQENIMSITEDLSYQMNNYKHSIEYFSPEIKSIFTPEMLHMIDICGNVGRQKMARIFLSNLPENFYENREKGENETEICQIIRKDLIDDFIIYVNKTNFSLNSKIEPTIYECNPFLLKNWPTLIEYATFYGSIQIFKYLELNGVKLTSSLWSFAVRSRNPEIIHLLEEKTVEPPDSEFKEVLSESLYCFHNEIAEYVKENLLKIEKKEEEPDLDENNLISIILQNQNFAFSPDDLINFKNIFYYLCNFDYFELARIYLKSKNIDPSFLVDLNDYEAIESRRSYKIGKTCYWRIIKNDKDEKFVIKTQKKGLNEFNVVDFEKFCSIRYPSLLPVKGYSPYFKDKNKKMPSILFKYCENGSLFDYINNINSKREMVKDTKDYILILGIAISLKYLHEHDIDFNRFHPKNVLIDENFYPIISDFFFYSLLNNYGKDRPFDNDVVIYAAPEFGKDFGDVYIDDGDDGDVDDGDVDDVDDGNINFTKHTNIYTFSLIMYQIIADKKLWVLRKNTNPFFMYHKFINGLIPDISVIENENVSKFLLRCWDDDPENRPDINQVIDFITSEEFCSVFNEFDHKQVIKYLDQFGDEFNNLKSKF